MTRSGNVNASSQKDNVNGEPLVFDGELKEKLAITNERCEADDGYRGEPAFINLPGASNAPKDNKTTRGLVDQ